MATKLPAVPKTFEEFQRDWDSWIDGAIEKVSHGYTIRGSSDANDIKQQVYLRILEQKHIEKFDVTKGSFTHHIYRVVLHVISNLYDRNTRNPLAKAMTILESGPEEGSPEERHALVLETYVDLIDEGSERQVIMQEFFEKFEAHLISEFKPWGSTIQMPDGSCRRRSLALVFRLMRQTMDVKEIAKTLHVTTGSVFSYFKKIKAEAEKFRGSSFLTV